jgi:hypothetical protein
MVKEDLPTRKFWACSEFGFKHPANPLAIHPPAGRRQRGHPEVENCSPANTFILKSDEFSFYFCFAK